MSKWFKELLLFKELLFALILREIKVRYKQTALGALWAIMQPLSLMLIFTIIFGFFLKVDSQGIPYPIFSYSALLPWTFFSTSISFGSLSIVNNSNLITKIYFPREVLPLASLGAAALDFFIACLIFIALFFIFRVPISVNILYVLPIGFLMFILTAATLLFLSALVVIWRDLKFVIPLFTQILMFATPVIYPIEKIPQNFKFVYKLNPLATLISDFRDVTVFSKSPDLKNLLLIGLIILIFFIVSYTLFKKIERRFADII